LASFSEEAKSIVVGSENEHFKKKRYKILAIARHSETIIEFSLRSEFCWLALSIVPFSPMVVSCLKIEELLLERRRFFTQLLEAVRLKPHTASHKNSLPRPTPKGAGL